MEHSSTKIINDRCSHCGAPIIGKTQFQASKCGLYTGVINSKGEWKWGIQYYKFCSGECHQLSDCREMHEKLTGTDPEDRK